jgi:demethylmenaquinone methyltransferase/2-methoxy-6-polyprenyl-1,4-benzoquinol methylase
VVDDRGLLEEQQRFYRAATPVYDGWKATWTAERTTEWAAVEYALGEFAPAGDVLELAGGTGSCTALLARHASALTVIDSAPEALAVNRARVARSDVEYVVADVFEWQPTRQYDVVFFSFWLSHVPTSRFKGFWSLVRSALRPDGRVFLIDDREEGKQGPHLNNPSITDDGSGVQLRRLPDGSEYRVVKVMYEPDELNSLLRHLGWKSNIEGTASIIYGTATRPLE